MDKRKRLIELLVKYGLHIYSVISVEDIADYLLKNGVEPVVRCKDCIYFQPKFVLTNDEERRPYTEEEKKKGCNVTADMGINCGSRCERFTYWKENNIPVWFNENDFCSYGIPRESEAANSE